MIYHIAWYVFPDGPGPPTASICLPAQTHAETHQVPASSQGDYDDVDQDDYIDDVDHGDYVDDIDQDDYIDDVGQYDYVEDVDASSQGLKVTMMILTKMIMLRMLMLLLKVTMMMLSMMITLMVIMLITVNSRNIAGCGVIPRYVRWSSPVVFSGGRGPLRGISLENPRGYLWRWIFMKMISMEMARSPRLVFVTPTLDWPHPHSLHITTQDTHIYKGHVNTWHRI